MTSEMNTPERDQFTFRVEKDVKRRIVDMARVFKVTTNELVNNMFRQMLSQAGYKIERTYTTRMVAAKLGVHTNTVKNWIRSHPEWEIHRRGNPGMRIPHRTLEAMIATHSTNNE